MIRMISYFLLTISFSVSIGWFVGTFFKKVKRNNYKPGTYLKTVEYEEVKYRDYSVVVQVIVSCMIAIVMTIIGLFIKAYIY